MPMSVAVVFTVSQAVAL